VTQINGICDLRRIIVHLIGEMTGLLAIGHRPELTGSRTSTDKRDQERRLPVRAVLALGVCPGREVPLTAARSRRRRCARAPQMPVPQHCEGPAGGTRARGR
jgi:hypothetical protein